MIQWIATFLLKLLQGVVNPQLEREIADYFARSEAQQKQAELLKLDIANLDDDIIRLTDEKIATVVRLNTAVAGANDAHNRLDAILNEKPKPVSDDPLRDLANRL